ncbi:MAG: J domain-containing protein [Acetatifactor sp.]|nr:J domain-containing protein [Acetatifactor sp.]
MSIWEILGIPPTTDIVTIKKAYADRAKEWHPEEHPEEFKHLRNAYQTAVKWAKSGGGEKAEVSVEPPPAKRAEPQQQKPHPENPYSEEPQPEERSEEEEPQPEISYDDVSAYYQI